MIFFRVNFLQGSNILSKDTVFHIRAETLRYCLPAGIVFKGKKAAGREIEAVLPLAMSHQTQG